jgi:hypothetical protein
MSDCRPLVTGSARGRSRRFAVHVRPEASLRDLAHGLPLWRQRSRPPAAGSGLLSPARGSSRRVPSLCSENDPSLSSAFGFSWRREFLIQASILVRLRFAGNAHCRSGATRRRWRTAFASRSRTPQMHSKEYGQFVSSARNHCFASEKSRLPRVFVAKRCFATQSSASCRTAIMSPCSGVCLRRSPKCCDGRMMSGCARPLGTPPSCKFASTAIRLFVEEGRLRRKLGLLPA